ncbi:hypothetical protein HaLaN_28474 [Haematococcus lacustris]|uniref:Uncharacterized protein n=1 Tax=Haematococcus lacustris TaxID=44745 RepID=A0A6A0AAQ2_HAELA|nr:hypothetical protein HaLaN_28474 [Haematococcus lacustris]
MSAPPRPRPLFSHNALGPPIIYYLTLDIGTGAASVALAGGFPSPRAQLARGQPRSGQPPGAQ